MRNWHFLVIAFFLMYNVLNLSTISAINKVEALKDTLTSMASSTNNALFKHSCQSFINAIEAQAKLSANDSSLLATTYDIFTNDADTSNCRIFNSYLKRERALIISWQSPVDGTTSMAWLTLPTDWDPEKTYPLYVHLHGLSDNYGLPIRFLTRSYIKGSTNTTAYENGYLLNPWGRGNLWYQGISETDVWESIAETKRLVNIDVTRQYLTGHSMGGYGAMYIASRSAGEWAALGLEAAALQYNSENLLKNEVVQQLKDLPTYFVTGTNDGLLYVDQKAYNLLVEAGNTNAKFVTFEGGHEHLNSNDEALYTWMKEFVNDDYSSPVTSQTFNPTEIFCFPNPVTKSLSIVFSIQNSSFAELAIYNAHGQKMETIVNQKIMSGKHEFNCSTSNLMPGMYCCKLAINGKVYANKIFVKAD